MNCSEFRRICDTTPACVEPAYLEHAAGCAACAEHAARASELDALIRRALLIRTPHGVARFEPTRGLARRDWLAIAASIVAAVGVSALLWLTSANTASRALATEVVVHIEGEPQALAAERPEISMPVLRSMLAGRGITVDAALGPVVYAEICVFGGREIPHLVVATEAGPVTVLVLAGSPAAGAIEIDERGFAGRVVATRGHALAIVGRTRLARGVEDRIVDAIEWGA